MQNTVKFINGEASSIHGNLKVASVYTTESGEWKLGGFEVLSNVKDSDAVIYVRTLPRDYAVCILIDDRRSAVWFPTPLATHLQSWRDQDGTR